MHKPLTFTCGLRLPACRILITTISSQSRQETFVPPKNTSPDKQSSRQLKIKIIALFAIPVIVFAAIFCREGLDDQQIADLAEIFNFSKFGAPVNGAIITFLLLLFGLFAFFPLIRLIQKFFSALTGKYFVISLATLAVLGAVAALYIPSYTNWFKSDTQQSTSSTQNDQGSGNQQNQSSKDPSSDLRLHLLYIAGGIIAVLGLIETNRKNSQDHIRQVHAARRDRYIQAVDKLSSKQTSVRLGGVYALVGLVDEWLDDDNIDEETQTKEGQVIINNLCSYIRSPFPLAEKIEEYEARKELEELKKQDSKNLSEDKSSRLKVLLERFKDSTDYEEPKDITADYAEFHEEQDVRRTIFDEIHKRSSNIIKDEKGKVAEIIPGLWSDFDFNFSRAPIFYPLKEITFESPIFTEATFYKDADFSQADFVGDADFKYAIFNNTLHFNQTCFIGSVNFSEAKSKEGLYFRKTRFLEEAYFTHTLFKKDTIFDWARFKKFAHFEQAGFFGRTSFHATHFKGDLGFIDAYFEKTVDFRLARFEGPATFSAFFKNKAPLFVDPDDKFESAAYFSYKVDKNKYNFFVITDSPHKINRGEAELDGIKRQIPVGAVLFDPDSGRTSGPAKPIEESDNPGKTPSK